MGIEIFKNRRLVIATKHNKEKIIAPMVEKLLHVQCFVPDNFDTDQFGTFTREIERRDDPITTVRKKCLLAMEVSNCDLSIASEGSFGAHPTIFFANADEEIVMLADRKNGIEIVSRELSTETNFDGKEITTLEEAKLFASKARFPSHGIIIQNKRDKCDKIYKGITRHQDFERLVNEFINEYGCAYLETDMRALFNPTRMTVIEKATEKLMKTTLNCCPHCGLPGFSVIEIIQGLPCNLCGNPTGSALSLIYGCSKCGYKQSSIYPHEKENEDPMYCDYCNP